MIGLFDYLTLFAYAFFGVLALFFLIRLLDVPTLLKKVAGDQETLLEGIHAELKLIRQELERR
jgi:hypothetical protein